MHRCPVCPHCKSFYSYSQRGNTNLKCGNYPLLLNCGHTYCGGCVNKLAKEENNMCTSLACPQCKFVTTIPDNKTLLKTLRPNYYLIGMLVCSQHTLLDQELRRLIPSDSSSLLHFTSRNSLERTLCNKCNTKNASCYCPKCDIYFCGLCFHKIHSESNTLRLHQAVEISDSGDGPLLEEKSPVCSEHNSRIIEYFCEDDLSPICSRCVILGKHKGHSITSMEDKNREVIVDMEPCMRIATKVVNNLKKVDQTFSDYLPNVKTEINGAIEDIRSNFHYLHGSLQAREQDLINEVYDKYNEFLQSMLRKKFDLLTEKRKIETTLKAAQKIIDNHEAPVNAQEILDRLNEAKAIPCSFVKVIPEPTECLRWSNSHSLDDTIKSYGTIEGSVPIRFILKPISDSYDLDETDTISTLSHDSLTDTINSGEDVIIEDESGSNDLDIENNKEEPKKHTFRAKYPGHCEQVLITHINSPTDFYCQRNKERLNALNKKINTWCRHQSKDCNIPHSIREGDMVIGLFSQDRKWYRGRVLRFIPAKVKSKEDSSLSDSCTSSVATQRKQLCYKEDRVEIMFLDYGNSEILPLERLKNMQQMFLNLAPFALHCALHDIEPNNDNNIWSLESSLTIKKMTDGKVMFMNVLREINGILQVDLHIPPNQCTYDDRPESLRESLIFLEMARFASSIDLENIKSVIPITYTARNYVSSEPRMECEVFDVIVTCPDTPFGFFVQALGDEHQYMEAMMSNMQMTYSVDSGDLYTVYCPQKGMICAAMYTSDGLWYRGKVVNIPGKKLVDVQYVDFGYVERIPYWNIRKILDSYLVLPPQAVYCKLCDIEPLSNQNGWSAEALKWWRDNVSFKKFQLKIQGEEEEIFSVVLNPTDIEISSPSMNNLIVDAGYAVSTGIWSCTKSVDVNKDDMTNGDLMESSSLFQSSFPITSSSKGSSSADSTPVNTPYLSPRKCVEEKEANHSPDVMPKLKPNVGEKLSTNEATSPDLVEVVVSCYVSPSDFYLQLAKYQHTDLKDLKKELQKHCEKSPRVNRKWVKNDFCAVRYSSDKLWYRAYITEVVSINTYKVFLVDYGYKDTVTSENIRELKNDLRKTDCFAVHCHLSKLYPAGCTDLSRWSLTAKDLMMDELKGKKCYLNKVDQIENSLLGIGLDLLLEEEVPETALEPSRTKITSMINTLIDRGLAIPKNQTSTDVDSFCPIEDIFAKLSYDYEKHSVPTESELDVLPLYVDYDGVIYAQIISEDPIAEALTESLNETYNDSKPIVCDWVEGQACIALYETEEIWCRGKVMGELEDKARVLFVDYGSELLVSYTNIRPINPELVKIPLLCLQCVLHGIQPVSEDGKWPVPVLDYIHNQVVNQEVNIEIKSVENEYLSVTIQLSDGTDLGEELVLKQHAYRPDITSEIIESLKISQIFKSGKLPMKQVEPYLKGLRFPVQVTHVELPNLVYCQHEPVDIGNFSEEFKEKADQVNQNLIELQNLSINLNNSAPQGHKLSGIPKPGDVCSAEYSVDKCWYRAIVIETTEQRMVHVVFVDYGNSESLPVDKLRELPKKLQKLPMQAMRCYLADLLPPVERKTFSIEALQMMPGILGREKVLASVKRLTPLEIELYSMRMEGTELPLAYQSLIDNGLLLLADKENQSKTDISENVDEMESVNNIVLCEGTEEDKFSLF